MLILLTLERDHAYIVGIERDVMSHLLCATSDAMLDLSSSIFHNGNLGNLRIKTMTIRTCLNPIEKASV